MRSVLALLLPAIALSCGPFSAWAGVERTQTIQLRTGWNAVFLEVQPVAAKPAEVFANLPVEMVAAYFPARRPVYFPRNPDEHPWQDEDWRVWYAPSRLDAFLSNLHALQANHAYLIRAASDFVVQIAGQAELNQVQWQPDSLNLLGFSVDPQKPPTFEKFFQGTKAHSGGRFFRLEQGRWTLVRDPANTTLRSGEAYWIECKGASDYQGPLTVKPPSPRGVDFGLHTSDLRVEFVNRSLNPTRVLIEAFTGRDALPLAYVSKDLQTLQLAYPELPATLTLSSIPAGESQVLRLAARRERMTGSDGSALLRVSNGEGAQIWIPVKASRPSTTLR